MNLYNFKPPYNPYDIVIMKEVIGYGAPLFEKGPNGETIFRGFHMEDNPHNIHFGTWLSLIPIQDHPHMKSIITKIMGNYKTSESNQETLNRIILDLNSECTVKCKPKLNLDQENERDETLLKRIENIEFRLQKLEKERAFNPLQRF